MRYLKTVLDYLQIILVSLLLPVAIALAALAALAALFACPIAIFCACMARFELNRDNKRKARLWWRRHGDTYRPVEMLLSIGGE